VTKSQTGWWRATEGEEGRKRRTRVVAPLSSSALSMRSRPRRSRPPCVPHGRHTLPRRLYHLTALLVTAGKQQHFACRARPCARSIHAPPSSSTVRPAFPVCNSSPENACARTRPYPRPRPRSRAACGLSGLSMRRGLWPRRYMPSSISIRTPERLLVQSEL
jgi:hypothetical protein